MSELTVSEFSTGDVVDTGPLRQHLLDHFGSTPLRSKITLS
jgi:hypothetical protein